VSQVNGTYMLVIWLDGQQILQQPEPSLAPNSLLAFSASTGGLTDVHAVRVVTISAIR
jgi:hypothetical protein